MISARMDQADDDDVDDDVGGVAGGTKAIFFLHRMEERQIGQKDATDSCQKIRAGRMIQCLGDQTWRKIAPIRRHRRQS